jgi:release factor glutamine methyltransferase
VVHDYEPHLALFSGELGLESYSRLLPQAAERLFDGGYLLLEVGIGQSRDVARLVTEQALVMDEIVEDLQGIPRCLVAHKP